MICSCHPLTPEQLVEAVCQDPETDAIDCVDINIDDVLGACYNLLFVDPYKRLCRFSHLSVQEYFENRHWDHSGVNGLAAKVCLVLLNSPAYHNSEPLVTYDEYLARGYGDLVNYATLYWATHVQRQGDRTMISAFLVS